MVNILNSWFSDPIDYQKPVVCQPVSSGFTHCAPFHKKYHRIDGAASHWQYC